MDYQLLLIVFIVIVNIIHPTMTQNSNLNPVLIPKVATTYLGGSVTFICIKADISMLTAWQTKLLPVQYKPSNNINVTLTSGIDKIEYNNTSVQCITKYPDQDDQVYSSNESKILIQGLLSSIEPNVIQKDPCTVEVYWNPPFTLIGVPILGYNINMTNINTEELLQTFTNSTSIQVPLGDDYNISIAAVNGAGEGNKSVIFINSTDFNENYNISQIKVSRKGNKWNVEAQITNDILCKSKSNQEIIFNVCKEDGSCYTTNNISSHTASNITVLTALMPLPEDQFYNFTVVYDYDNFTLVTGYVLLSTYDLQKIYDRKDQNEKICLLLEYAKGSEATGCHIKLFCDSEKPLVFDIKGFNKIFHEFWCSPPFSDKPLICHLNGYDMVGNQIAGPAVQLEDVTISPINNSSTITTLKPSVTTTPKNSTSRGYIAGIVAGVLLACLIITSLLLFAVAFCKFRRSVPSRQEKNENKVTLKRLTRIRSNLKVVPDQ